MFKKMSTLLIFSFLICSINSVIAVDEPVHHVRKNHDITSYGKGAYSSAEEAQRFYNNAVNDVKGVSSIINEQSFEESADQNSEKEVSNFIKNDTGIDDGYPYLDNSAAVNDSKSIYTDNLGRKHFFGKKNLIRY